MDGLFCSTPMIALSRNVPAKHGMDMLLAGDMTSAARDEILTLFPEWRSEASCRQAAWPVVNVDQARTLRGTIAQKLP